MLSPGGFRRHYALARPPRTNPHLRNAFALRENERGKGVSSLSVVEKRGRRLLCDEAASHLESRPHQLGRHHEEPKDVLSWSYGAEGIGKFLHKLWGAYNL